MSGGHVGKGGWDGDDVKKENWPHLSIELIELNWEPSFAVGLGSKQTQTTMVLLYFWRREGDR